MAAALIRRARPMARPPPRITALFCLLAALPPPAAALSCWDCTDAVFLREAPPGDWMTPLDGAHYLRGAVTAAGSRSCADAEVLDGQGGAWCHTEADGACGVRRRLYTVAPPGDDREQSVPLAPGEEDEADERPAANQSVPWGPGRVVFAVTEGQCLLPGEYSSMPPCDWEAATATHSFPPEHTEHRELQAGLRVLGVGRDRLQAALTHNCYCTTPACHPYLGPTGRRLTPLSPTLAPPPPPPAAWEQADWGEETYNASGEPQVINPGMNDYHGNNNEDEDKGFGNFGDTDDFMNHDNDDWNDRETAEGDRYGEEDPDSAYGRSNSAARFRDMMRQYGRHGSESPWDRAEKNSSGRPWMDLWRGRRGPDRMGGGWDGRRGGGDGLGGGGEEYPEVAPPGALENDTRDPGFPDYTNPDWLKPRPRVPVDYDPEDYDSEYGLEGNPLRDRERGGRLRPWVEVGRPAHPENPQACRVCKQYVTSVPQTPDASLHGLDDTPCLLQAPGGTDGGHGNSTNGTASQSEEGEQQEWDPQEGGYCLPDPLGACGLETRQFVLRPDAPDAAYRATASNQTVVMEDDEDEEGEDADHGAEEEGGGAGRDPTLITLHRAVCVGPVSVHGFPECGTQKPVTMEPGRLDAAGRHLVGELVLRFGADVWRRVVAVRSSKCVCTGGGCNTPTIGGRA